MTDKSIDDILRKAHREIQETHGIALSAVYYDLLEVGSMSTWPKYEVRTVSVEGVAEHWQPSEGAK